MSFYIGDIAHWDTPKRIRGLFMPGAPEGINFKTKLYQPLQITDAHEGEAGRCYSGWMLFNGRKVYLESVLETQLIGKSSWAKTLPMLEAHPALFKTVGDFPEIRPAPLPGHIFVLQRSIYTDSADDHTTLAVSCAARYLRALMTKDLLEQTAQKEIGRKRITELTTGVSEEGQYHLSWSAEWDYDSSAYYTIFDVPLLMEETDVDEGDD